MGLPLTAMALLTAVACASCFSVPPEGAAATTEPAPFSAVAPIPRRRILAQPFQPDSIVEEAIDRGLRWLVRHQGPDGAWHAANFSKECVPQVTGCLNPGQPEHTSGATAAAVLAFMGDGSTHTQGRFRNQVKAGLRFLIEHQAASGAFTAELGMYHITNHVLATLAVVESYNATKSHIFKKSAVAGLRYLATWQLPGGGFPSSRNASEEPDPVTSAWALITLMIENPLLTLQDDTMLSQAMLFARKRFEDAPADPANMASMLFVNKLWPVGRSQARIDSAFTDLLVSRADFVMNRPKQQTVLYSVTSRYFAEHVTHQQAHRTQGSSAILLSEHARGCTAGSWTEEESHGWAASGGRVASTALTLLTLQVPRHFRPLVNFQN
ncbi:MAG: hypothetical protein ACI9EF_001055 [Pseudohongiellaceae bacterium]|jgi:hypothetical protein